MTDVWSVPRLWPGKTVLCIAGGPSLDLAQVRMAAIARRQDRIRAIAINDACYPAWWADVLYASDARWWLKHEGVPEFHGLKVTISNNSEQLSGYPAIKVVENTGTEGLETKPTGIRTGRNGGYQAMNLAVHFGSKRIVLLGYDMKFDGEGQAHWFGNHEDWKLSKGCVDNVFRQAFPSLAKGLAEIGVEVINATPGSMLDVFPKQKLETLL